MDVDEPAPPGRRRLRISLQRLALAVVAVTVAAGVAGYLFGRGTPERAAATLISDRVQIEPPTGSASAPADTDEPAPTSGDHRGSPRCGIADAPLSADDQLASLAAGRVLIQYRPSDLADEEVARLRELARDRAGELLLAPNRGIDTPVVATAWARRMSLEEVRRPLLSAFVTAYAGSGPDPRPCTRAG